MDTVHAFNHMNYKTNIKAELLRVDRGLCVISLCTHNEALRETTPPSIIQCPLHVDLVMMLLHSSVKKCIYEEKREEQQRCALLHSVQHTQ